VSRPHALRLGTSLISTSFSDAAPRRHSVARITYNVLVETLNPAQSINLAVFVYDPLTWIVSLFLAVDLACTAVGLFIVLARQSGTRCQINLEILTVLMVLNDSWKHFQPLLVLPAH